MGESVLKCPKVASSVPERALDSHSVKRSKFLFPIKSREQSKPRSQEGTAIQMGAVLPYKLEVYCSTFSKTSRGWGFRNSLKNDAIWHVYLSGQVRPRQGTEIYNFGVPSPLEALHWIFCFFSSIYVQFSKTSPLKSGESSEKSSGENRVKSCHVCACHGFFGPEFGIPLRLVGVSMGNTTRGNKTRKPER